MKKMLIAGYSLIWSTASLPLKLLPTTCSELNPQFLILIFGLYFPQVRHRMTWKKRKFLHKQFFPVKIDTQKNVQTPPKLAQALKCYHNYVQNLRIFPFLDLANYCIMFIFSFSDVCAVLWWSQYITRYNGKYPVYYFSLNPYMQQ